MYEKARSGSKMVRSTKYNLHEIPGAAHVSEGKPRRMIPHNFCLL